MCASIPPLPCGARPWLLRGSRPDGTWDYFAGWAEAGRCLLRPVSSLAGRCCAICQAACCPARCEASLAAPLSPWPELRNESLLMAPNRSPYTKESQVGGSLQPGKIRTAPKVRGCRVDARRGTGIPRILVSERPEMMPSVRMPMCSGLEAWGLGAGLVRGLEGSRALATIDETWLRLATSPGPEWCLVLEIAPAPQLNSLRPENIRSGTAPMDGVPLQLMISTLAAPPVVAPPPTVGGWDAQQTGQESQDACPLAPSQAARQCCRAQQPPSHLKSYLPSGHRGCQPCQPGSRVAHAGGVSTGSASKAGQAAGPRLACWLVGLLSHPIPSTVRASDVIPSSHPPSIRHPSHRSPIPSYLARPPSFWQRPRLCPKRREPPKSGIWGTYPSASAIQPRVAFAPQATEIVHAADAAKRSQRMN